MKTLVTFMALMAMLNSSIAWAENYVLREVIELQGTCWENHAGQRDSYAGQVVRWQRVGDGTDYTYGVVYTEFSVQRTLNEVTHRTEYHMPSMVSFTQIDIDTSQPKWVLHGISAGGENSQGYDTTCEVDVVKRGMELPGVPQEPTGKQGGSAKSHQSRRPR
jgi:hypothetical protein